MRPFYGDRGIVVWKRTPKETIYFRRVEGSAISPKKRLGIIVAVGQVLKPRPLPMSPGRLPDPPEFWVLETQMVDNIMDFDSCLIAIKDDWLLDCYWLPKGEEELMMRLQNLDGLTGYEDGFTFLARANKWSSYRSKETTASVRVFDQRQDSLMANLLQIKEQGSLKVVAENNQALVGSSGAEAMMALATCLGAMQANPLLDFEKEEEEDGEDSRERTNSIRSAY